PVRAALRLRRRCQRPLDARPVRAGCGYYRAVWRVRTGRPGRQHRRRLRPDHRPAYPGHRDAQAPGRENHHRYRAQGPEDPGRERSRQVMTQQPQPPRPDPIGDFQRWLMKSSAKNLGREVRGNFRKTFGRSSEEDVWSQATREVPDEPPECEWCPICRAARKYRDSSGPGVGGHLTGAGDAFASVVSDAFSAVESALSVVRAPSGPKTPSGSPEPSGPKTPSGSPEPSGPE